MSRKNKSNYPPEGYLFGIYSVLSNPVTQIILEKIILKGKPNANLARRFHK